VRGEVLPCILLLVDEFQEFFTEDDPISSQASQILDRLVRQGRAFGLHVLLGSQTLAGAYTLARSTIDQMAVRIALQCSEADSRLILADDNPAARLLSRPGEAIYNDANGLVEGNSRFQVAWLPDDRRDDYLAQVAELAQQRDYRPPRPQIVFEGNAPAEVEKNRPLQDLLTGSPLVGEGPGVRSPRRVLAWLGDPIAIRDPIAATFRRQSGSNLLIVGQNDEAALGMMTVALISLAAQTPSPTLPLPGGGRVGVSPYQGDGRVGVRASPSTSWISAQWMPPTPCCGINWPASCPTRSKWGGAVSCPNSSPNWPPRSSSDWTTNSRARLRAISSSTACSGRATCVRRRWALAVSAASARSRPRPIRRSNSPPSCARDPTWASTPWSGATR